MKSNIKLTEKQKEVIRLMREGKELYTIFYSSGSPNVINGMRIFSTTFSKLSNSHLIELEKTTTSKTGLERSYWQLTQLGKIIDL